MRLLDIVADLEKFDPDQTIFAVQPWSSSASAMVAPEPDDFDVREGLNGHAYFLEVFIAREFLDDWAAVPASDQSPEGQCNRLISYAINDA